MSMQTNKFKRGYSFESRGLRCDSIQKCSAEGSNEIPQAENRQQEPKHSNSDAEGSSDLSDTGQT